MMYRLTLYVFSDYYPPKKKRRTVHQWMRDGWVREKEPTFDGCLDPLFRPVLHLDLVYLSHQMATFFVGEEGATKAAILILFLTLYSFQSLHLDHLFRSPHLECTCVGGFLGRRTPPQNSFEEEESSWDGPGTKSARLNWDLDDCPLVALTPFVG